MGAMSQDSSESGIISTLKKRFSVDDLVVLLVSEGIGVPLTIAGGEAFAHEQMRPAIIGYGVGLPLMAIGFTFPFWKNWVADRARTWIVATAYYGLPILLLLAILYVLGPLLLDRVVTPDRLAPAVQASLPSAFEIADAVVTKLSRPTTADEMAQAIAKKLPALPAANDIADAVAQHLPKSQPPTIPPPDDIAKAIVRALPPAVVGQTAQVEELTRTLAQRTKERDDLAEALKAQSKKSPIFGFDDAKRWYFVKQLANSSQDLSRCEGIETHLRDQSAASKHAIEVWEEIYEILVNSGWSFTQNNDRAMLPPGISIYVPTNSGPAFFVQKR
jgi:hypothetical protein